MKRGGQAGRGAAVLTPHALAPGPQDDAIFAFADELGVPGEEVTELCRDEKIVKRVLQSIRHTCATSGLATHEIPQRLILTSTPWTVESGDLTVTSKLRRRAILHRYMDDIASLPYGQLLQPGSTFRRHNDDFVPKPQAPKDKSKAGKLSQQRSRSAFDRMISSGKKKMSGQDSSSSDAIVQFRELQRKSRDT